ncbi:hypothetical protein HWV62_10837 [Athelia sp. TMB]|nr:hypothetical protein HWV62_10837 [Athelia sp. TMB]
MVQIVDPIAAITKTWQNPPTFAHLSGEDVGTWLSSIKLGCEMRGIHRQQWADVALHFLSGDVKDVLAGMKRLIQKIRQLEWKWESFEIGLARICEEANRIRNIAIDWNDSEYGLKKFVHEHPHILSTVGIALIGAGILTITPELAIGLFRLVGFGSAGPIAGSIAAALQSAVYGGGTTGVFSACQSFGMTAAAASPAAITAACAAIAGGRRLAKRARIRAKL